MSARSLLFLSLALLLPGLHAGPLWGQSDALGTTPEAEQSSIDALRGITSNLQKNRDGTVRFVRFSKSVVTDDHLKHISAFTHLDYLAVVTPKISDAGISHISDLTNLDTLILTNTRITDQTTQLFPQLKKLQTLYLDNTQISGEALKHLTSLENLEHLSLSRTAITAQSLRCLSKLPNLKILLLQHCPIDDDVFPILSEFRELTSIYLDHTRVTGEGIDALQQLEQLTTLSLCGTDFNPVHLNTFRPADELKNVLLWNTGVSREMLPAELPDELVTRLRLTPAGAKQLSGFQRYVVGQDLATIPKQETSQPATETIVAAAPGRFSTKSENIPDFQRHVIPLLGKLGCNSRECHGSFQGKGGFALTMFGYDFQLDHNALLAEGENRVVAGAPDKSLMLLKPSGIEDHEGGQLIEADGWQYQLLARWISAGAPIAKETHELLKLEVTPQELVFSSKVQSIPLKVMAYWSSGEVEDVTALARLASLNADIATIDQGAVVQSEGAGDTHIIVSYDRAVVPVPVLQPVSDAYGENYPIKSWRTPIDKHVGNKLSKLGIIPADVCSDTDFLRRTMLDLAGTLPTKDQIEQFQKETSPDKRRALVEMLLESEAYADWWAMRITDITGCNSQHLGSTDMNSPAAVQWEQWIRARVKDNISWDKIAAGIVLADSREPGQSYDQYALEQSHYQTSSGRDDWLKHDNSMHYYWARSDLNTAENKALNFSYAFLGVRLQCAQCHKHPFDQWSKQDFDHFKQMFARIKWGVHPQTQDARNALLNRLGVPHKLDTAALRRQMYIRVSAEGLPIPWFELTVQPPGPNPLMGTVLGSKPFDLNQYDDPREPLFAWLVSDDNPYFAKAFVNRVWAQYFGTGIINPVDDISAGNPPSNQDLMAYLEQGFRDSGFDMKWLHREIILSDTYQRSWETNSTNQYDGRNFSHSRIRRLPAEILVDAIEMATARSDSTQSYLSDTKTRNIRIHPRSLSPNTTKYSLIIFGKPTRGANCDCERTDTPTLLQNLYIKNDREIIELIERKTGWLAELAQNTGIGLQSETGQGVIIAVNETQQQKANVSIDELIVEAHLRTLSRRPTDEELQSANAHISECENVIEGMRDLLWALINTDEFITNH